MDEICVEDVTVVVVVVVVVIVVVVVVVVAAAVVVIMGCFPITTMQHVLNLSVQHFLLLGHFPNLFVHPK